MSRNRANTPSTGSEPLTWSLADIVPPRFRRLALPVLASVWLLAGALVSGAAFAQSRVPRIPPLGNIEVDPPVRIPPDKAALVDEPGSQLSIPGLVSVTLQPAEAVTEGARWSLDGGSEQLSAVVVGQVSSGSHRVRFRNLPGWTEPEEVDLLVIGGKQATMSAVYRPLPRFYFRAIPEQRIQTGKTLELVIHTEDPGDPLNPGAGAALQVAANPPPVGTLTFEAATGLLSYAPSVLDRLPFTLSFTTAQGLAGAVEITPLNIRPPEESVIEYDRPLPDAESRDYMVITSRSNGTRLLNDAEQETFNVEISGQTLVIEAGHPAHLLEAYGGRQNLESLKLYADRVIIRSPLLLPQTRVVIHARELRFEQDGSLQTVPKGRIRVPTGAVYGDGLLAGNPGDPGHNGGDVDVFVERFHSDAGSTVRFVMGGGDGGPAGQGRNGAIAETQLRNEANQVMYPFGSPVWHDLMRRRGVPVCDIHQSRPVIYLKRTRSGKVEDECGSKLSPRGNTR